MKNSASHNHMATHDPVQWLAALAGKPSANTPASTLNEAQLLRLAVLDYLALPKQSKDIASAQSLTSGFKPAALNAWQSFQHRATHSFDAISASPANAPRYALAACIAMLGMGIAWQISPLTSTADAPPVVWRGDELPTTLRTAQPAQDAASLEQLLIANGIKTYLAQGNQTATLQAKIPLEDTNTRAMLKARGIDVPPHGRLNLVFVGR